MPIFVYPTFEQHIKAGSYAHNLGVSRDSIRDGDGNYCGYLGEIVVADYFGWKHESTYDYDVIDHLGRPWDVKSKERTVSCSPKYLASITDFNTEQKCFGYCFASVNTSNSYCVEIMGFITKDDFYKRAFFAKEGDTDPYDPTYKFKADCWNIQYQKLLLPKIKR